MFHLFRFSPVKGATAWAGGLICLERRLKGVCKAFQGWFAISWFVSHLYGVVLGVKSMEEPVLRGREVEGLFLHAKVGCLSVSLCWAFFRVCSGSFTLIPKLVIWLTTGMRLTRLETRTKESNICASLRVRNSFRGGRKLNMCEEKGQSTLICNTDRKCYGAFVLKHI